MLNVKALRHKRIIVKTKSKETENQTNSSEIIDYRSRHTTLIKLVQSNIRLIHNILSKKRASESRVKATYLILVISLFSQQSKAPL